MNSISSYPQRSVVTTALWIFGTGFQKTGLKNSCKSITGLSEKRKIIRHFFLRRYRCPTKKSRCVDSIFLAQAIKKAGLESRFKSIKGLNKSRRDDSFYSPGFQPRVAKDGEQKSPMGTADFIPSYHTYRNRSYLRHFGSLERLPRVKTRGCKIGRAYGTKLKSN